MREEVCFIDLTFWGHTAEIANQYLQKGSKVLIEGRLMFEQWQDNSGQNRSKHTITVESMEMLNSANTNANGYPSGYEQQNMYQGATDALGYPVQNAQNNAAQNNAAQNNANAPAQHGNYSQMPPEVNRAVARNNTKGTNGDTNNQNGFAVPPDEIPF